MPMEESPARSWGSGPCYPELIAILFVGAAHVGTELAWSPDAATIYNVAVAVAFLGYVVWRLRYGTRGAYRVWGMRLDNLGPALRAHLSFAGVAALGFVAYGLVFDSLHLGIGFWLYGLNDRLPEDVQVEQIPLAFFHLVGRVGFPFLEGDGPPDDDFFDSSLIFRDGHFSERMLSPGVDGEQDLGEVGRGIDSDAAG